MKTFTVKEILQCLYYYRLPTGLDFGDNYRNIQSKRFRVLGHSVNYRDIINTTILIFQHIH